MRGTQPARLLGAASLAVMVTALSFADAAPAESREARMCATQTESLADQRIAACAGMLSAGRLQGKAEGVAYALRGLAYLDRGDIAHAIADLNQAISLAPDFAIRIAAMPGMRAATTAKRSPTTIPPSSSIPIRPRLTSTAPPCGATSAMSTARWRIIR